MFGNGAQWREDSSEERNSFNPEDHVELVCRTPRRFALGKVGKDGYKYEDEVKNPSNGRRIMKKSQNEGRY